jgi:hypothetical protein
VLVISHILQCKRELTILDAGKLDPLEGSTSSKSTLPWWSTNVEETAKTTADLPDGDCTLFERDSEQASAVWRKGHG